MRRNATGSPYSAEYVTQAGATDPAKASAITAATAARESTAMTAATIMMGCR